VGKEDSVVRAWDAKTQRLDHGGCVTAAAEYPKTWQQSPLQS
jgi:hypothetical protein